MRTLCGFFLSINKLLVRTSCQNRVQSAQAIIDRGLARCFHVFIQTRCNFLAFCSLKIVCSTLVSRLRAVATFAMSTMPVSVLEDAECVATRVNESLHALRSHSNCDFRLAAPVVVLRRAEPASASRNHHSHFRSIKSIALQGTISSSAVSLSISAAMMSKTACFQVDHCLCRYGR